MSLLDSTFQRGNINDDIALLDSRIRILEEKSITVSAEGGGGDYVLVSVNDQLAGTLIDKLLAGAGITLSETGDGGYEQLGISIESHLTPNAHHNPVTAGDGITVTVQQVAVDSSVVRVTRTITAGNGLTGGGDLSADRTLALTTPGSLTATSTNNAAGSHTHAIDATIARAAVQIIAGTGLTGGGDLAASRTLNVAAGNGLTVAADSIALTTPGSLTATSTNNAAGSHTHAIDATIARSAITITAGDGMTGGGDLTANRTLNVVAGNGLTVAADSIALTTPGTLTVASTNNAAGSHTHAITSSTNPGTAASLLATTAAGLLTLATLAVTGNITAGAVNSHWIPATTNTFDFGSTTKFWNKGYVGELWSSVFVGSNPYVSRASGWQVNVNGEADFRSIFADSLEVQTFITDNVIATAGTTILTKSRAILSRDYVSQVAGNTLYVYDLPGSPDTPVFNADDIVSLRFIDRTTGIVVGDVLVQVSSYVDLPDGEQSWTADWLSGTIGQTIYTGTIALDYGESGDGFILSTAVGPYAPYTDVRTWAGTPSTDTTHARFGMLEGITSVAEYGLFAGISATEKLIASDGRIELHGASFSLYEDSTETMRFDPSVPSFSMGSTLPGFNGEGVFMGFDAGDYRFSVGSTSQYIAWDGGGLEVRNATVQLYSGATEVIRLDPATPAIKIGNPLPVSFGDTGIWLGNSAGTYKARIGNANDYVLWDGTLLTVAGKLLIDGASEFVGTVTIGASGGIYQGTGTFASPTTGLKIWNSSGVGRIAGFNAGVEQVGFATDGKLKAAGGTIVLDAAGISMNNAGQALSFTQDGSLNASIGLSGPDLRLLSHGAAGANLTSDSSFESGVGGWTIDLTGEGGSITWSTTQAQTGTHSIYIQLANGIALYSRATSPSYTIAGGAALIKFSFKVTAKSPSNVPFDCVVSWNNGGGDVSVLQYGYSSTATGWVQIAVVLTKPAGSTALTIKPTVGAITPLGYVYLYVDDVTVQSLTGSGYAQLRLDSAQSTLLHSTVGLSLSAPTIALTGNGVVSGNLNVGGGLTVGYPYATVVDEEIRVYNGGTLMGQFSTSDTTWFRINQDGAKNIYTPRAIVAAAGFSTDASAVPGTGAQQIIYGGDLLARRVGVSHAGYIYVPYTVKKTSTNWDGDAKTAANNGIIDLSVQFGLPANVKAINVRLSTQGAAINIPTGLGPSSTHSHNIISRTQVIGTYDDQHAIVNCDANGDVYFTTGGSVNVYIEIWGYYI